MEKCSTCGKDIEKIDIGLSKRLINRGLTHFYCVDCLAKHFNCDKDLLLEKAEHFKKMGCSLF